MRLFVLVLSGMAACSTKEPPTEGRAASPATATKAPRCVDDTNKRMSVGKLSGCLLAAEWTAGNLTCKRDHMLDVYPDGALKRCSLLSPTDLGGFRCVETTELYEDGKFKRCKLAAAKTVNDIYVRAGDWVTVYKSGAIKRVEFSSGAGKLKGLLCKGLFNFLHENGHLKKCEIAEATKIDGQDVTAGTLACFDDRGKRVSDCKLLTWEMLD